jgi:TonB family protein
LFQTASAAKLRGSSLFTSLLLHCAAILLVGLVNFPGLPVIRRDGPLRTHVLIAPSFENPARGAPKSASQPLHKLVRPRRDFDAPPPRARELAPRLVPDLALTIEPVRVPLLEPTPALELTRMASPPAPTPPTPPTVKPAGFASAENAGADLAPPRLTAVGGFETASKEIAERRGGVAHTSGFVPESAAPVATISARPVAQGASGFGDASVATPSPGSTASSARGAADSATVAAQILDKPQPPYSAEARRLKIEGEVLLEVVFQASGEAKVARVIHGLGHGLDEAAVAAARQIRFRPAQRGGAAIDSSAVVHIVFQLAY